eukprot:COSAG01_NODE_5691_length_4095_cov_33.484985_1_plen_92_part_10
MPQHATLELATSTGLSQVTLCLGYARHQSRCCHMKRKDTAMNFRRADDSHDDKRSGEEAEAQAVHDPACLLQQVARAVTAGPPRARHCLAAR